MSTAIGALSIWLGYLGVTGRIEGTEGPVWVAFVFGTMMLSVGLLLLIGVANGVGDNGERPASMPWLVRLFIDALGYLMGAAFAIMMGVFAFGGPAGSGGVGEVIGRFAFGFFAILIGGLVVFGIVRAIVRALLGLPYDDGASSSSKP